MTNLIGLALVAALSATTPVTTPVSELPVRPANATLVKEVPSSQCGEDFGAYIQVYDVNPDTQAAYTEIRRASLRDGAFVIGDTLAVAVTDDEGGVTVYIRESGVVYQYTVPAFQAKYESFCVLPGMMVERT